MRVTEVQLINVYRQKVNLYRKSTCATTANIFNLST
jgi:hypothetical protein